MDLNKALDIFSIDNVYDETEVTLKKKYKKLMIKYHPDNYGNDTVAKDVSLAFELLSNVIKELKIYKRVNKSKELLTIVIPLEKLMELYSGGSLQIGSKAIYSRDIQKNNSLIITSVMITHNGTTTEFSSINHWTLKDNYEVNCDINVDKIDKQEDIIVTICGEKKNIKFSSNSLRLKMSLKFNIYVDIVINKRIVDKNIDRAGI